MITAKVIRDFEAAIRKWRQFTTTEQDEIVSTSLERLHQYYRSRPAEQAYQWLLSTASRVRFEVMRERDRQHKKYQAAIDLGRYGALRAIPRRDVPHIDQHSTRGCAIADSDAWSKLPHDHRELLQRVIVEELPIAVAARQLGVCRSTAKSWIERDTKKLRDDAELRSIAGVKPQTETE